MRVTTRLVYDVRPVAEVRPVEGGLRITFRDGSEAFLDSSHPNFEILRINAESSRGRPVPVGVALEAGGRIVDLNTAHETSVQSIQECPGEPARLKVALWGYSPVCYLGQDHPEFGRIHATLARAAGTRTMVWVANHSEMAESESATDEGEVEMWWKIMDVRPVS